MNNINICPICGNKYHNDMMITLEDSTLVCIGCASKVSVCGGSKMVREGIDDDTVLTLLLTIGDGRKISGMVSSAMFHIFDGEVNFGRPIKALDFRYFETNGKMLKSIVAACDEALKADNMICSEFASNMEIAQFMAIHYEEGKDSEEEMKELLHNCWYRSTIGKFNCGMGTIGRKRNGYLPDDHQAASELVMRETYTRYPKLEVIMPLFVQLMEEPATVKLREEFKKYKEVELPSAGAEADRN